MSVFSDVELMRLAIDLARARVGTTEPNPAVGCVIAKNGQVVAQAATAPGGRPHAEEQALAMAGQEAFGATAFVTLEPCGERSSGVASCAQRLIASGVVCVVYACDHADGLSAGRGPKALRAAGLVVEAGFLAGEAKALLAI